MSVEYDSVSSRLTAKNENHIHTRCLFRSMNLSISQVAEYTVPAISLFGLLQQLGTFFKNSYKRMVDYAKTNRRLKLGATGKTR